MYGAMHSTLVHVRKKEKSDKGHNMCLKSPPGSLSQAHHCLITFCVSHRRRKMYCGHARLCVCLSVRSRTPTLLHGPGCNLGAW